VIIPSPAAHSSSTSFLAPQYLATSVTPTQCRIYHIIIIANIFIGLLAWGGWGWGGKYVKWHNVHKDFFFRMNRSWLKSADDTHSERSNGVSPSLFPYGRILSEKCLFLLARHPRVGHGLLIHEVSRSHTTTHHSR
jgi:hypothetical protein